MAPLSDDDGSFLASGTFVSGKYTDISRDQANLLSTEHAWNTKGIPNLPPKVLQDVKEAFVRKQRAASLSEQSTPSRKLSPSVGTSSRQVSGRSQRGAVENRGELNGQEVDQSDEDNGTPIPWTPSPPSNKRAHVGRDGLPTLGRDTLHPPSSSPVRPSKRPAPPSSPLASSSLPPPSSPPVATRSVSPPNATPPPAKKAGRSELVVALKAKAAQHPPPSSLASEPDLEFQPPRAITDVVSPVSRLPRSAQPPPLPAPTQRVLRSLKQPAPTPPSAQELVTVPCTWTETGTTEGHPQTIEEPAQKRRRLHKPPPFDSSQAMDANRLGSGSKKGQDEPVDDVKDSQSSHSSSSISMIGTAPRTRYPGILQARDPSPNPPLNPLMVGSLSSSGRLPPNGPVSQAPYVDFKMAYPSYTGTLADFVSAALNIIELQESCSLAEFLYDDFIRVWAHHFVPYIRNYRNDNSVGQNSKPLRAIQWYNEHVARPVFTKRMYTKGNIADIPKHYAEEAGSYRRQSGRLVNDSSSLSAAPPSSTRFASLSGHSGALLDMPQQHSDTASLPAGTPSHVVPSGTPLADGEVSVQNNPVSAAQPPDPVHVLGVEVHAAPRLDNVDKVEPLRSVPGYVVTISQPGSSPGQGAVDQQATVATNSTIIEIKEEEEDEPPALPQPFSANTKPDGTSPTTPSTTNMNRYRAHASHGSAASGAQHSLYHNGAAAGFNLESPAQRGLGIAPGTIANTPTAQPAPDKRDAPEDKQSVNPPQSSLSASDGIASQPSVAPASTTPVAVHPTSRPPAHLPAASVPPQPGSPLPSSGDILTQPPATAVSFFSDLPRSSVPETAVKPKNAPKVNPLAAETPILRAVNYENEPPASSAPTTASSKGRRRRMTKAERFGHFVKKKMAERLAQSSAPMSSK